MIELTPPDEMAALHDYGHLLLDDAPAAPTTPWFTVTKLEFDTKEARNATLLRPKAIAGTADLDGRKATLSIEPAPGDGCYHLTASIEGEDPVDQTGCAKDGFNPGGVPKGMTQAQLDQLKELNQLVGIATVQVDGKWYVSPTRTVGRLLPGMILGLQGLASSFGSFNPDGPAPSFDCIVPTPSSDDTGASSATTEPTC
jgi:hypothetical protein